MSSKQTEIGQCFVSIITDAHQLEKMLQQPQSEREKELLCSIMSQVSEELRDGRRPSLFYCYLDSDVKPEMIESIKATLRDTNSCFGVYVSRLRNSWRFEWRRNCGLGAIR